jgi:branched-chain amino acid transport system substrate-binding protein
MVDWRTSARPRPVVTALVMLVALLSTAACGPTDHSVDFGSLMLAPGEPLLLGVSVAHTGDTTGDAVRIERGVRLAVEQVGALVGHPLSVEVRDDGCSAEGSVAVARAFTAAPQVVGVVGPMCSRGCVPASLVYDDAKMVMITPTCTASVLTRQGLETIARVIWNDEFAAVGGARFAAGELKVKRVYAVNDGTF